MTKKDSGQMGLFDYQPIPENPAQTGTVEVGVAETPGNAPGNMLMLPAAEAETSLPADSPFARTEIKVNSDDAQAACVALAAEDVDQASVAVIVDNPAAHPFLPEGWTEDDIRFLLEKLKAGSILVADAELGIPTIHDNFGGESVHYGFGVFGVKTAAYELSFCAGGAMDRTPSQKGWTHLNVTRGEYHRYDTAVVRKTLEAYLSDAGALVTIPGTKVADEQVAESEEAILKKGEAFLEELRHFTGTETWTRCQTLCVHRVLLTEGALHVAEHGGENDETAYWLMDVIASYQGEAAFRRQPFQVWTLQVHLPDAENHSRRATVIAENGNGRELVRQEIAFTNFRAVKELKLYASIEESETSSRKNMIILLPSEY